MKKFTIGMEIRDTILQQGSNIFFKVVTLIFSCSRTLSPECKNDVIKMVE